MLEFIKVTDDSYAESIQNILLLCGRDMHERNGLTHWLRPYSKENIRNDILNKDVFIVKSDGINIGTFTLAQNEKDSMYISKLAVVPENSGQGIGRKCMSFIEEYAIGKQAYVLKLDVYDKSLHAIDFYIKWGFIVTGERPTTNFRVLLMEKNLK